MSFINIPSYSWLSPVETLPELPLEGNKGDVRLVLALNILYEFDGITWSPLYNSSSASSSFVIVQTPTGTYPTATSPTDVLSFTSSDSSVTITGNSGTDTIDFKVTSLGFTPEDVANKAVNLLTNDDVHYPTTKAVKDAIDAIPTGGVTSFNTRTGAVTPQSGDYSKSDVGLSNVQNLDQTNPSNITQDTTHRFSTDTEKTYWNAKQPAGSYEVTTNKATDLISPDNTKYPTTLAVSDGLNSAIALSIALG